MPAKSDDFGTDDRRWLNWAFLGFGLEAMDQWDDDGSGFRERMPGDFIPSFDAPRVVLSAFALELYLKATLVMEGTEMPKKHGVSLLFDEI